MEDSKINSSAQLPACRLDSLSTDDFLTLLGQRVRAHRTGERMSRKRLAEVSGVSERYLAQLEAGQGNMSIALLRKVTAAIGLPLTVLLSDDGATTARVVSASRSESTNRSSTHVPPIAQPALRAQNSETVDEKATKKKIAEIS